MKTLYKWSVEDYHSMIEAGILEGKPVELLEGAIVNMSPEGIPHRRTNHCVTKYLRQILDSQAEIFESHPVTLDNSEPEPDIAVVRLPETIYNNHHPYAEDIYWLVEIANKSLNRDLNEKSITYARNNIPEYWVIDLVNNKVVVFTNPLNSKYQDIQEFTSGVIQPVSFPQVEIQVNKLLLF